MRLVLTSFVVCCCISLGACNEPILSVRAIPEGVDTSALLFHRTQWFGCAAAVYQLEPKFALHVRQDGLGALPSVDAARWRETPVPDDMSKETANLTATLKCLEGTDYRELFQAAAYQHRGYYLQTPEGGTDVIAPGEGILLVGGYE